MPSLRRSLRAALLGVALGVAWPGAPLRASTPAPLPPGNLDLLLDTAALAVRQALSRDDLGEAMSAAAGERVRLSARDRQPANWVLEYALVTELLERGLQVYPDSGAAGGLTLSYRLVDLGLWVRAGLLGSAVERRCRVTLSLQLARGGELVWSGEATGELTDRVPKRQMPALANSTYPFAKVEVEEQTWGRYVEPVIVSSVLGSLVYLFFSNR
ncbi:MAG: DUF4136 domain-containing protein [Gemmatimonadota bacterium]